MFFFNFIIGRNESKVLKQCPSTQLYNIQRTKMQYIAIFYPYPGLSLAPIIFSNR